MNSIKDEFIKNLTKELNSINEDKIYHDKRPLDVCYLISSVDQHLGECKDFIEDITNNTYYINGYEEDNTEGYTNGKIRILIEKPEDEKESDLMVDSYREYCYFIEFLYDGRDWGYCECSPENPNYNKVHKCCGNGCDWTAPAYKLTKEINMHYGNWNGQEKDYWEYEENFKQQENNNNKDVEEYNKIQSIKYINSQIEELQNKLVELEQ